MTSPLEPRKHGRQRQIYISKAKDYDSFDRYITSKRVYKISQLAATPTLVSSVELPTRPTNARPIPYRLYQHAHQSPSHMYKYEHVSVPIKNILLRMCAQRRTWLCANNIEVGQAIKIIKMFVWDFSSLYLDCFHTKFCLTPPNYTHSFTGGFENRIFQQ